MALTTNEVSYIIVVRIVISVIPISSTILADSVDSEVPVGYH